MINNKKNKKGKLIFCGYWISNFHYVQDDKNDIDLSNNQINVVSKKIDKKLISAILGIFLNLTFFVPVNFAVEPNKNLNIEIVEFIGSNKIKKLLKKNSSKIIQTSQKKYQKKERKENEKLEKKARINLLKTYIFLKQEFRKLNPSFDNYETICLISKTKNFPKISVLPTATSQNQENIVGRIRTQRIRFLRSGTTFDDEQSEKKVSPNVSSSVLKIYIAKLVKKLQVVTKWIDKNPTLFSMGIIGNISLIYLYRNGYFGEWYNLIRNSSPRFLELANNFNKYFQPENKYFSFSEKVYGMDPEYFSQESLKSHEVDFSILKNDQKVLRNQKEYIFKEKNAIYVEEQQDLYSSQKQVEREPTIEDYTDHFQYWELILDLKDQNT